MWVAMKRLCSGIDTPIHFLASILAVTVEKVIRRRSYEALKAFDAAGCAIRTRSRIKLGVIGTNDTSCVIAGLVDRTNGMSQVRDIAAITGRRRGTRRRRRRRRGRTVSDSQAGFFMVDECGNSVSRSDAELHRAE